MKRWKIVVLLLLAAALLVWIAIGQMPDGRLHVFLLDVEGGQGVLVRTPAGRVAVIDGGSQPSALLAALGSYLPYWQHTLHAVIATNQGSAALLPLLDASQRYEVIHALAPPAGNRPSTAYVSWRTILQQRSVPLIEAQAGTLVDLADGTLIEITDVISTSLSLRISYAETSVFLPGPQPAPTLPLDATVVAFPLTAKSQPSLILADSVATVVLFTGKRSTGAQQLPTWPGVDVFSTARDGTLELVSDGRSIDIHPVHR